jgi:UDP-N-acetylmuramate dehydrogenase
MPKLQENVPLRQWSNYKIGGPARFFFSPKDENEVRWAVQEAKARKLPVFILGGGTNLLIDDRGFPGLVLRPDITVLKANGGKVTVGAGVLVPDLLDFCVRRSLAGLEWAGGLPGTVGGAIRGNAGCFGGEMKDVVESVRGFDMKKMKIVERRGSSCKFGYRTSVFKQGSGSEVILDATLRLHKGDKRKIAAAIKEKIAHRKKNHPLDYPNIGSIFKNVPLTAIHKSSSMRYAEAVREARLVFRGSQFSVKTDPFPVISAAKLISESGLRGVSAGGAMISGKHPNFIVNVLGARSPDVAHLIQLTKAEVKKKFGIVLEEEVQIV